MMTRDHQPIGPTSIIEPGRLLTLGRRHWVWLLLPPLLAGLAGWSLSARGDSRYEATAMVVVRPTAASALLDGDRSNALAERELQTEERLLNGPAMGELVDAAVGDGIDFEASAIEGTDLLEITAQAGGRRAAADAADAIAELFIEQRRDRIERDLASAIEVVLADTERLERELADAPTGAGDRLARELDQAQSSLDRLEAESALPGSDARIASAAVPPNDRVAPRPARSAVLGAMLGLLAGLGLVWLRDLLDRRIRGVDDLPDVGIELEFAGPVPRPETRNITGPAVQVHHDVADRFRVLANASLGNRSDRFVIQVTGVRGGEGASFVAANLAASLAIGGWTTALVDADLDQGGQHQIFQVAASPGTKELLDGAPVDEVLQKAPTVLGLSVVATGARIVSDASLHRSGLDPILSGLSSRFDVVVIDGPPILGAGDAAVLATHVDKTILVSSANQTTQPQLERAIRAIGASEGQLTALVLVEPASQRLPRGTTRQHGNGNGTQPGPQPVTRESIETLATTTKEVPADLGRS